MTPLRRLPQSLEQPWKSGPSRAALQNHKERKQLRSAEGRCRRAKLAGNLGHHQRRCLPRIRQSRPTPSRNPRPLRTTTRIPAHQNREGRRKTRLPGHQDEAEQGQDLTHLQSVPDPGGHSKGSLRVPPRQPFRTRMGHRPIPGLDRQSQRHHQRP